MPREPIELEALLLRRGGGQAKTRFVDAPLPRPKSRSLRAAQILALAHEMDRMIETGAVRDRADMARLTGFDDSRISQIMNLPSNFLPDVALMTLVIALVVTIGIGLAGTWRILGQKAAPVLREL